VHGFSHGTGQQMDSDVGLVGARVLTWDWPAHGPISRQAVPCCEPCVGPCPTDHHPTAPHRTPWIPPRPTDPSYPAGGAPGEPHPQARRPHHRLRAAPRDQGPMPATHRAATHLGGWSGCQNKPWLPQGVCAPPALSPGAPLVWESPEQMETGVSAASPCRETEPLSSTPKTSIPH